jgi:amino acid transporter
VLSQYLLSNRQDHVLTNSSYWHDPGAFRNGFKGFCSVFVTAAFAFGGTELAGLAAAEAADPSKSLPRATKQVFTRIFFFYIVNTFILGLIVRSDDDRLLNSSGANTKASP